MDENTPTQEEGKGIGCRFCGHGKHWHLRAGPCNAPEGPGWECDCQAWDYGANIFDIPIPGDDETSDHHI